MHRRTVRNSQFLCSLLMVVPGLVGNATARAEDAVAALFACSFDTGLAAETGGGRREPVDTAGTGFTTGPSGKALQLPDGAGPATVVYSATDNFRAAAGSIDFRVRLDWDYTDITSRSKRIWLDVSGAGKERYYLHSLQNSMVFGIFDDTGTVHAVYAAALTQWKKGEWHRVTCTWDLGRRNMAIAIDGVLESEWPTNAEKGSWQVTDAALKTIRIGGWGNNPLPIGGVLDDLRVLQAPLAFVAPNATPALDPVAQRKTLQSAAEALRSLERAIATAERAGLDTAYAEAVATTARTGLWRLTQSPVRPSAAEMQRWCAYLTTRCPEAETELAATLRDRTREKRVPRPDVFDLKVDGDVFRNRNGETVLLMGARNIQPKQFSELSRFFNLIAWNSGAPDRWIAQVRQNGFAGQAHLSMRDVLEREVAAHPDMRNVEGWCGHNWATGLCIETERTRRVVGEIFSNLRLLRRPPESSMAYVLLSAEDEYMCWCPDSQRLFRQWLAHRYEGIERLNRVWGTHLDDFSAALPPRLQRDGIAPNNRAAWYDWQQFNRARTTGFYAVLKSLVRSAWPAARVCGGTHLQLAANEWGSKGVDPEELNRSINDVIQCETMYNLPTASPAWDLPDYGLDLFGECFLDFQRSTCDKPATDLEYHAWLRYVEALHARHGVLPANYTYASLLRHFLHGIRAVDVWAWQTGRPEDQWPASFSTASEHPPASVEELLRAALDIRRLSGEIVALSRASRQVGILVSDAAYLQVHPSLARSYVPAPLIREMNNVAHGAMFLDTAIGYVSERSIAAGALAGYRVILVPAIDHLDDATLAALLRFVEEGGRLIVTPRSFVFDEHHRLRATPPGFPEVRGARFVGLQKPATPEQLADEDFLERQDVDPGDPRTPVVELHATEAARCIPSDTVLRGTGVRLVLAEDAGAVVARFADDNSPAIVRLSRGTGFIHYCAIPLGPQSYARLLEGVLQETKVERLVRLRSPEGEPVWGVEARACRSGDDVLVYAINLRSEPVEFDLTSDQPIVAVHDHLANQPGATRVRLEGLGVALVRLKMGS